MDHAQLIQGFSDQTKVADAHFLILVVELTPFLRWFETVFHFPFQLNFIKGLLVCSKRLLLLVDSRCCNVLSTS